MSDPDMLSVVLQRGAYRDIFVKKHPRAAALGCKNLFHCLPDGARFKPSMQQPVVRCVPGRFRRYFAEASGWFC